MDKYFINDDINLPKLLKDNHYVDISFIKDNMIQAYYGCEKYFINVTDKLINIFCRNDRIYIPSKCKFNNYFGDPKENVRKQLIIKIKNDHTYVIYEDNHISFEKSLKTYKKKVIDSFMFFNESKLLKMRLKELNPIVDYFIIVEATITFAGQHKPLYYQLNSDQFKEYHHKIIHVVVDDLSLNEENAWNRERFQRSCISRGLKKINIEHEKLNMDDIIMICDLDEIPDITIIKKYKENDYMEYNRIYGFYQDMYYYHLNCKSQLPLYSISFVRYDTLMNGIISNENGKNIIMTPENIRMVGKTVAYEKCGWHLSYFNTIENIIHKIQSFSHQEFNTATYKNPKQIKQDIKNCKDIFKRDDPLLCKGHIDPKFRFTSIITNKYLPNNYRMLLPIYLYISTSKIESTDNLLQLLLNNQIVDHIYIIETTTDEIETSHEYNKNITIIKSNKTIQEKFMDHINDESAILGNIINYTNDYTHDEKIIEYIKKIKEDIYDKKYNLGDIISNKFGDITSQWILNEL